MKVFKFVALGMLLTPLIARADNGPTNGPTQFTIADSTQVPGKTLKAGVYTIRVVDHLSDRMIVSVDKAGEGKGTIFLALPVSGLPKGGNGPITLSSKGKAAMRGFTFPDGTVAEFVYPKAEAVSIAKANDTTIPAIDPASEGRVADPKLSSDDMKMVTLWMLTPTPVGPGNDKPGIAAARYEAPAAPAPAAAQSPTAVSSNSTPAPAPRPRPRPAMAALPHTASNAPLELLMGLLSIGGAVGISLRRRVVGAA